MTCPPGRRIALVGANGAGKSTVAAVLLRFCELSGGAALLNGHNLASYAADDIRSVIGGYPQDPHLFDATIRDNLRLAHPGATDEQHQLRHSGGPYQRMWDSGYEPVARTGPSPG